ncbi:integral membrane [Trichoderma arundinaceum]|uniref:Integral membrane n=1 Tax=Trichoderma arundinaceum TaxID=490622 RepID=A0A395NEF3_TRIAR|nr:integral membrane [Trichoderma arundinaceum]
MPRLPNAAEIAYMEAHISDTVVPDIIVCTAICGGASVIFIVLRLVSRMITKATLQASDWLILFAWLNFAVFDVCFAMTVKYGGGRHIILVTDPEHARLLQVINIINENLYCVCMAFIKFSILSMYHSIFPQRGFHYCLAAVAVFMALWAISCAFVAIFQCTPIAYGWDPTIAGGFCVNYGALVLVAGICNIITDFVILAMPIPLVLKLNLSPQRKRMVIFTFAMGGRQVPLFPSSPYAAYREKLVNILFSACIVSIVRLAFTLAVGSTADGSWDNMPAGMLSVVELMTGILAASLPIYRPLYRRIVSRDIAGSTERSSENPYANGSRSVKITGGGYSKNNSDGIVVTDEVDIDLSPYNRKGGAWVRVEDEDESGLYTPHAERNTSGTA